MAAVVEHVLVLVALLLVPAGGIVLFSGFRTGRRRWQVIGIMCLAVSALLLVRMSRIEFWAIDACLDGGGHYDAPSKRCDHG